MRPHPAFAPVIVFILATFAISLGYAIWLDSQSVWIITKWIVGLFGGAWVLQKIAQAILPSEPTGDQPLYSHDPWADIPDATVTALQGGATRLDARGRAFVVARGRRSGKLAAREINPRTGTYISEPIYGAEGDDSLAEHLKFKINEGR